MNSKIKKYIFIVFIAAYLLTPLGLNISFAVQYPNPRGVVIESVPSNESSAEIPLTIQPPTNLVSSNITTNSVALNWIASTSIVDGYSIERNLASDSDPLYITVGQVNATTVSLVDTLVSPDNTYNYRIRAFRNSGISAVSSSITVIIPPIGQRPATPTNLTVTVTGATAVLSWTDNADNETGYDIEYRNDENYFYRIIELPANTTTHTITYFPTPPLLQPYSFRVYTYNLNSFSDYSNTVTALVLVGSPVTGAKRVGKDISTKIKTVK